MLIAGWLVGAIGMAEGARTVSGALTGVVEASPALATITGTVRDDAGKPLSGAIVALLEPNPRGRELQSVRTDTLGKFSAAVVPGLYGLRATAEGFSSMLTRVNLDRSGRVSYNFALKRTGTLVQKRGDSEDYRWIARSAPRQILNFDERGGKASASEARDSLTARKSTFHGLAQLLATQSSFAGGGYGAGAPGFFGLNFAVAGSLDGNVEVALIGQRGIGRMAPQRLSAIATMKTSDRHEITASIGYGQVAIGRPGLTPDRSRGIANLASLDQVSVAALGSWQVSRPLLVIYGLDYSRFVGSASGNRESLLPRMAIQYGPGGGWSLNLATTPGRNLHRQSVDEFKTENIRTSLEVATPEVAFADRPILDRSRRYEMGIEKSFNGGQSGIEASGFYDLISGHGVGIMALPLEASPATQEALQRLAYRTAAMNGAARGGRLMFRSQLGERLTAAIGYSAGSGSQFRSGTVNTLTPGRMFHNGFFQVAAARLDLDLSDRTGTRISTVIRLSPSAVVFAIDPFAGRMSVYDPNINIYITQDLPNLGLPVEWQAIVDVRNLLNQATAVEDGATSLLATRTSRTIRGGVAFRW